MIEFNVDIDIGNFNGTDNVLLIEVLDYNIIDSIAIEITLNFRVLLHSEQAFRSIWFIVIENLIKRQFYCILTFNLVYNYN